MFVFQIISLKRSSGLPSVKNPYYVFKQLRPKSKGSYRSLSIRICTFWKCKLNDGNFTTKSESNIWNNPSVYCIEMVHYLLRGEGVNLRFTRHLDHFILSPPSTTKVPYANSLDLDRTPSNSASYPDPSYLTLRQHFYQFWVTLKHFEKWGRREV